MFIVKSYYRRVYKPEIDRLVDDESESGPFETHEEASRFAIGLAKTGQAYKTEIGIYRHSPGAALLLASDAYLAAEELLRDTPKYQVAYIKEAIETLSKAIGYLRSNKELTDGE